MKHTRFAIAVSVCLAVALSASGQEKKKADAGKAPAKMEMPKPGPEVKKLGYFVGNWSSEGEMKENPMGIPAGHFSSNDKCEWFTGGYQVVCHTTGKSPMGPMHSLGILSWNANDKEYTYYGIDSMGMAEGSKGNVSGDTWTYTAEEKMGGKTFKGKYTIMTSAPDSYTFKYETSDDGQKWTTMMEGKSTKAAAKKS